MDHIVSEVVNCISTELNNKLIADYSSKEVFLALKGMGPTKALGPDGFSALFFQKFWHIVGGDVSPYYLEILNHGMSLESLNRTNIILIPKTPNSTSLKNFRPISLCTILYKIIYKTIANRIQVILDLCIDEVQSAFVSGRLITDIILLAYEVLHTFKNRRLGKKGYLTLKVYMNKAYDCVEWSFLQRIMGKMGFDSRLIELIMRCISSTSYGVCLNGEEGEIFYPSRGLRQGDPLSPYLFLFCSEGLSALMRLARKDDPS